MASLHEGSLRARGQETIERLNKWLRQWGYKVAPLGEARE